MSEKMTVNLLVPVDLEIKKGRRDWHVVARVSGNVGLPVKCAGNSKYRDVAIRRAVDGIRRWLLLPEGIKIVEGECHGKEN